MQAPVLGHPLPEGQLIMDTDASNEAVGVVLSQVQDGVERVLAYYSKTHNRPERQYCVTRKELLAVVKGVRHFHVYLYGRPFRIRTDHAALKWLLEFRYPEGQVARWLQQLQEYDFVMEHRAGLKYSNADALSRRPCLTQSCKHCERLEARETISAAQESSANPMVSTDRPCHAFITRLEMASPAQPAADAGTQPESQADLRQAQEEDPDTGPLLHWVKSGTRPPWKEVSSFNEIVKCYWAQWDSLRLRDGILYRQWESPDGSKTVWQIVMPQKLQKGVFHQLHGPPATGHFGIAKTLGRVRPMMWVFTGPDVIRMSRTGAGLVTPVRQRKDHPKNQGRRWASTRLGHPWTELPWISWAHSHSQVWATNSCWL